MKRSSRVTSNFVLTVIGVEEDEVKGLARRQRLDRADMPRDLLRERSRSVHLSVIFENVDSRDLGVWKVHRQVECRMSLEGADLEYATRLNHDGEFHERDLIGQRRGPLMAGKRSDDDHSRLKARKRLLDIEFPEC
jgi:hypothetical protein